MAEMSSLSNRALPKTSKNKNFKEDWDSRNHRRSMSNVTVQSDKVSETSECRGYDIDEERDSDYESNIKSKK
jgi:hypothetical protein